MEEERGDEQKTRNRIEESTGMCRRENSVDWVKARERNYPLATENKLKGERGAKVEVREQVGKE